MRTVLLTVPLVLGALAPQAFGQTFGEISGLVSDTSGASIPGAAITVTNTQTNLVRTGESNEVGNYNFPALPPGTYSVRVEKQGFQAEVRGGIELQVQQTARIDFRLNLGSVSETVEVTGGAPLLNTENATLGAVIENKRIVDLPINGRNFVSLISLSSNVTTGQVANAGFAASRTGNDRGKISLSIAGNRRTYTYYTLDGVSNTDVDFNVYAFLPSIDALDEFKVQTGVYSAEFGREAGQVNISTKVGTNAYHGTLFEFLRNNALDARPYAFSSSVPASAPFKWNQYGFTLGGPIQIPKVFNGKNRLFFMSNYEGFKLRNQVQGLYSVPSAAMRTGDFSQILPATLVRDPKNGRAPFAGNIIPPTRPDPIAKGLLEFYPLPNIAGNSLVNNNLTLQNNSTDKDQFTQRIDFTESAKSNWFGRYSWQDERILTAGLYQNGQIVPTGVKSAMISNIHVLTPTIINEFRAGYLGYNNSLYGQLAFNRNVDKELAIPLVNVGDLPPLAWGIPSVGLTGFSGFGDTGQRPFATNDHTFSFADNVSWTRGTHGIKFGVDFRRDRYNVQGSPDARGTFGFQNQATGYGFSDYLLGYLNTTQAAAVPVNVMQLRNFGQAYYVNDSWKIRSNLTLEVGLRYEFTPAWSSKNDNIINWIIPTVNAVDFAPNAPRADAPYFARDCAAYGQSSFYSPNARIRFNPAIATKCVDGLGSTLVRSDYKDFAPRIGLSWSPSAGWTVRAGYGLFYSQDIGNMYFDTSRNMAGRIIVNTDLTTFNLTLQNPLLANANSNACGVTQYFCITAPYAYSNDPNRRTPYIEQYELNIQRQLGNSMVLEFGYLGSQGHHLQRSILYDYAQPSPTGSITDRTPFPEFSYAQVVMSIMNSNYNSGFLKLTRRLSSGLSLLAGYTWSRSMDTGSSHNPEGLQITKPQQGWCAWSSCGEYSRSDFDTRQRFVASALYELPFGKGKRMLSKGIAGNLLGGWQLNSIVSASTGFPVEVRDGVNQSNTQLAMDRPDAVAGVSASLPNPSPNQWFNIGAFKLQQFGTFGNVARNSITSPGVFDWDFSTLKNFYFTERAYLQFRFECFNCGNHPNFGPPGSSISANLRDANGFAIPGTGLFGKITTLNPNIDMRELQFSLKLVF
jgi:hypothetical protein